MSEESKSGWMSGSTLPADQREALLLKEVCDYAKSGDLRPFIHEILSGNLKVSQQDPSGFAAIHLAVWQGNSDLICKLLDKAACPVDLKTSSGQTSLMLAASQGHVQIMKMLIERGADIEEKDENGIRALLAAAQKGQVAAFYTLVNHGALLDACDDNGGNAAHWAAYKNQTLMLRILAKLGIDLKKIDLLGMTALHRAAITNSYSAAKYLLLNELDPYDRDLKGKSVFQIASDYKSIGVERLLVDLSNDHNPIFTFFTYLFLIYWGCTYYCYYSYVLEWTSFKLVLSLGFNFSIMWLFPLFLLCKYLDCSFINTSSESNHFPLSSQKDYENLEFFDEICFTCGIKRPARSKHCRFLDKCVLNYDHYCFFLQKTIGKENKKVFFFALLFNFLAVWLFLMLCWSMIDDQVQPSGYLCTYMVRLALELWKQNNYLKICIFVSISIAWYNFCYLFMVCLSISQGLTLNELVNRHRYRYLYTPYVALDDTVKMQFKNQFDKGVLNNFLDFLIN